MNKTTIYFNYGSMNSGKTLELLRVAYNYEENNITPLILKSKVDSRLENKIYSRVGLSKEAHEVCIENLSVVLDKIKEYEVVLIDEAQFLSKEEVDAIVKECYNKAIHTLMFFGLKNDFRGELFEGSKRIIELADKIEESTSICWCGKKSRQNARVINGKIIKDGPTVLIDNDAGTVQYVPLCNYHYFKGILHEEK